MHHWCKFEKKWGGQFYAFLQLCLNTEHWTLFTANMTRKELSFFDSGLEFGLSKAIHKDAERLIDFLNEWEATEGNKGCPNRSQVNWVWSKMEIHQQANTFDCGIGVEQFLDFGKVYRNFLSPPEFTNELFFEFKGGRFDHHIH